MAKVQDAHRTASASPLAATKAKGAANPTSLLKGLKASSGKGAQGAAALLKVKGAGREPKLPGVGDLNFFSVAKTEDLRFQLVHPSDTEFHVRVEVGKSGATLRLFHPDLLEWSPAHSKQMPALRSSEVTQLIKALGQSPASEAKGVQAALQKLVKEKRLIAAEGEPRSLAALSVMKAKVWAKYEAAKPAAAAGPAPGPAQPQWPFPGSTKPRDVPEYRFEDRPEGSYFSTAEGSWFTREGQRFKVAAEPAKTRTEEIKNPRGPGNIMQDQTWSALHQDWVPSGEIGRF
ncbi:MAG: hypothetical protein IPG45_20360 [Deltaproteobacteria bacterium]|jgi:hypothetical protein|nr:hypothetical protein [Deltaproteobacteria bacterium]